MSKISPCLWFDGQAEEAAQFYTSILPDSRIRRVNRAAARQPRADQQGAVLTRRLHARRPGVHRPNGGPEFKFNEAISFSIDCEDQAEVDRYWEALVEGGGEHSVCGWLKDRFGVSWQVIPRSLPELLNGPDREGAARAMKAMLQMTKIDVAKLREAYKGVPVGA